MSRAANQTANQATTETPGTGHVGDAATVPPTSGQPAPGSSEQTPVVEGLHTPDLDETDTRT
jgi:hypothetical protein